jgi:hypothetical protein
MRMICTCTSGTAPMIPLTIATKSHSIGQGRQGYSSGMARSRYALPGGRGRPSSSGRILHTGPGGACWRWHHSLLQRLNLASPGSPPQPFARTDERHGRVVRRISAYWLSGDYYRRSCPRRSHDRRACEPYGSIRQVIQAIYNHSVTPLREVPS